MSHFIKLAVLLSFIALVSGCATLTHINQLNEIGEISVNGNPHNTMAAFKKYYPTFDSYPKDQDMAAFYVTYCGAFNMLLRLDEYEHCIKEYGSLIKMPDAVEYEKSTYYIYLANRSFEIGDDDSVLKYAYKALEADKEFTPMRSWELIAAVHARRGEYDKVEHYIDKIDNFRLEVFFITIAEELISQLQRDAMTRIYLEMGDSTRARQVLNRKLREKSVSESVFEGVVATLEIYQSSLQAVGEKVVQAGVESSMTAGKKEVEVDWKFYERISKLTNAARISFMRGEVEQAKKLYRDLLREPNFKYQKSWYFQSLHDLAKMSFNIKEYTQAKQYLNKAIPIIETAVKHLSNPNERALFVKKREKIYALLKNTLIKTGGSKLFGSYCNRIKKLSGYSPQTCRI